MINLLQLEKDEKVRALVPYSNDAEAKYLFFVTKLGLVKRVPIEEFFSII